MILTTAAEKQLWGQQVGTGFLILKTAEDELLQVEVFLRLKEGRLYRIADGKPVLPLTLTYADE
jgi:hypothetical protein